MRISTTARLVAGLSALSVVVACTPGAPDTDEPADGQATSEGGSAGPTATSTPLADGAPEGLEDYYSQRLTWSSCQGDFECASLTVPMDYAEPDGQTIDLALLRSPASGEATGSLVVNPGGPGASGVDYAMMSGMAISGEVREAYDVVGFDPRGVGRSAPVTCFEDEQMDEFLSSDPSPDDAAEEEASTQLVEDFAQACGESAPDLLGHVSTVEAARDIDVLRAALGEEQLDYYGASYGTFLGTTYASLFPDRVGALVLDGAIEPDLSELEMGLGQAAGFERATRAYVENCVASGECPLGSDVESAMARIPAFLDELDTAPLPVEGDAAPELTEGWGMYGIIAAMYTEQYWPLLTQAFERAFDGDGTIMMFLANLYASRGSDGSYDGNTMQAIYAVNCLDRPVDADGEDLDSAAVEQQFEEASRTWGRYLAGEGACAFWPAEAVETVEDYSAAGADPILVIGTTRDPATPYEWAEGLAETLDSGVLLTYDGDGHTAYGRSNDCIDDVVDAYLLEGTVPEEGTTC
ncbi:alpha/beta hydrolase [Serinicoccus kebangsaanensis]|uniref:alpha/beta hydrolase n=1 Tax=Serinicoccus kebangsaanensis TaxID=2602069 RepID=UPI001EE30B20|nr:alpha/beta hydrolase [Serinicoccus kebangsaanensis]